MTKLLLPTNYLIGEDFTNMLLHVTKCQSFLELSNLFDVPKATFSTWKTHGRTSHELIIRLHRATGISIKALALGEYSEADNQIIDDLMPIDGKLPPYQYLQGSDFTSYLKSEMQVSDFSELSTIFDVPKATFSTWNLHNRTSHELMVRMLLNGVGDINKFIVEEPQSDSSTPTGTGKYDDYSPETELPQSQPCNSYFSESELDTMLSIAQMPDKHLSKQLIKTMMNTLIERNIR